MIREMISKFITLLIVMWLIYCINYDDEEDLLMTLWLLAYVTGDN